MGKTKNKILIFCVIFNCAKNQIFFSRDIKPTEPDQAFPRILRGSYRPTMLILSLLDFWGMYVMSWVFYGTKSMWVYHYMMLSNWTKDDHRTKEV